MREFELYGTVAAVFCFCDSMNYMLTEEDLLKVFRLVNNYLDPGGLFLFDMDTPYAFEKVMGDTTLVENRQEGTFIWENTFYPEEMINEVNLTLFLPTIDTKTDDQDLEDMNYNNEAETLYGKYEETHVRKAYSLDMMKQLIEKAGMEWVTAYDAETKGKPKNSSERIYILAREKHQEGKTYL
jgi:SAM-dependent methyltransferase